MTNIESKHFPALVAWKIAGFVTDLKLQSLTPGISLRNGNGQTYLPVPDIYDGLIGKLGSASGVKISVTGQNGAAACPDKRLAGVHLFIGSILRNYQEILGVEVTWCQDSIDNTPTTISLNNMDEPTLNQALIIFMNIINNGRGNRWSIILSCK